MIPTGLFTQILMIVASIAIIISYVKPTFTALSKTQDDIAVYREEYEKVASVNTQLQALVTKMESVPVADQRRLLTYLPDRIDEVAVLRDLLLIVKEAGVLYDSVDYEESDPNSSSGSGSTDPSVPAPVLPIAHTFQLSVTGDYEQIKDLLGLLEKNNYLFEVREANLTGSESDLIKAQLTLVTYTYLKEEPEDVI